jgi:hypothetical protein
VRGSNNVTTLANGRGITLYAGANGILGTSIDNSNFVARTSGIATEISALFAAPNDRVINVNSIFLYAGVGGTLRTSTDGVTWTARTSGTTSQINTVMMGNTLYAYAGNGGVLATSTNGITWDARTSGTTNNIISLLYVEPNTHIYAGAGGVLATSANAITWTAAISNTTFTINTVNYINNEYIYGTSSGQLATSVDGINWELIGTPSKGSLNFALYDETLSTPEYLVLGNAGIVGRSTNRINWNLDSISTVSNITSADLNYSNGLYVLVGAGGILYTATQLIDGETGIKTRESSWTVRTSGTTSAINDVIYNENLDLWALVGVGGVVRTSTNAITWTARTSGVFSEIRTIENSNNLFIVGGSGGILATSTDGITLFMAFLHVSIPGSSVILFSTISSAV